MQLMRLASVSCRFAVDPARGMFPPAPCSTPLTAVRTYKMKLARRVQPTAEDTARQVAAAASTSTQPSATTSADRPATTADPQGNLKPKAQPPIKIRRHSSFGSKSSVGATTFNLNPQAASDSKVPTSCRDESPAEPVKLTPLQRRQLAMKHKAAFKLTPGAVARVNFLLSNASPREEDGAMPVGIRVGVKKRGCSGYSYVMVYEYQKEPLPNDTHVECDGVHVYVNNDALFYVIGTVMDFMVSEVEEKFTFRNPNQKVQCGCGESFMI